MLCEVIRPFPAEPPVAPGQRVDVSAWRQANVEALIRQRYLRPIPDDASEPTASAPKAPRRA